MDGLKLDNVSFLVVDDNPFMRTLVKNILAALQVSAISEAEDGVDAFKLIKSGTMPDIIILDWNMPTLDGIDFIRLVRTGDDSPNPYVPIIMMTAHSEYAKVVSARDAGVTEILVKPLSAKSLYSRIASIILKPRPFVKSKTYFGPDRRRVVNPAYPGTERRKIPPQATQDGEEDDFLPLDAM